MKVASLRMRKRRQMSGSISSSDTSKPKYVGMAFSGFGSTGMSARGAMPGFNARSCQNQQGDGGFAAMKIRVKGRRCP